MKLLNWKENPVNWKENPGMFCNGKFQIMGMRGPGLFTMYCNVSELLTYQTKTHSYPHDVHIDNAWLIARKIEDMTDEEVCAYDGNNYTKEVCESIRNAMINEVEKGSITFHTAQFYLSIGVFPLPWDERGTVIDIKTAKL